MSHAPEPLRNRLDSSDPIQARGAELVASVKPLPESQARMRRVRRLLDQPRPGLGGLVLRPAVVVGVLVGMTAVAAATWGTIRAASEPDADSEPVASPPKVEAPTAPVKRQPRLATGQAIDNPVEPEPEPESEAAPVPGRTQARAPAASSEAALVQGAVAALRRDGDPEAAARMLDEYQKRNPDGVLQEEALALAIEAALTRKDPRAAELARQYLAKYPKGRFRQVATRALRESRSR